MAKPRCKPVPRESDAPGQAVKSLPRHRQDFLKGRTSPQSPVVPNQPGNATSNIRTAKVFEKLDMRPHPAPEMPSAV
jgi:hypothetical protein